MSFSSSQSKSALFVIDGRRGVDTNTVGNAVKSTATGWGSKTALHLDDDLHNIVPERYRDRIYEVYQTYRSDIRRDTLDTIMGLSTSHPGGVYIFTEIASEAILKQHKDFATKNLMRFVHIHLTGEQGEHNLQAASSGQATSALGDPPECHTWVIQTNEPAKQITEITKLLEQFAPQPSQNGE